MRVQVQNGMYPNGMTAARKHQLSGGCHSGAVYESICSYFGLAEILAVLSENIRFADSRKCFSELKFLKHIRKSDRLLT